jgi:two-component sensor histidine kinase
MGEIRILLKNMDEQVELIVEDDGVGHSEGLPAKGTGVGTRIVKAMCISLGGKIQYRPRDPGTAAVLMFTPKPNRAGA